MHVFSFVFLLLLSLPLVALLLAVAPSTVVVFVHGAAADVDLPSQWSRTAQRDMPGGFEKVAALTYGGNENKLYAATFEGAKLVKFAAPGLGAIEAQNNEARQCCTVPGGALGAKNEWIGFVCTGEQAQLGVSTCASSGDPSRAIRMQNAALDGPEPHDLNEKSTGATFWLNGEESKLIAHLAAGPGTARSFGVFNGALENVGSATNDPDPAVCVCTSLNPTDGRKYFISTTKSTRKMAKWDLSVVGGAPVLKDLDPADVDPYTCSSGAVDPVRDFMLIGTSPPDGTTARVRKINVVGLDLVDFREFLADDGQARASVSVDTYVLFACRGAAGAAGRIVKFSIEPLERRGHIALNSDEQDPRAITIKPDTKDYIWIGTWELAPTRVIEFRINAAADTKTGTLTRSRIGTSSETKSLVETASRSETDSVIETSTPSSAPTSSRSLAATLTKSLAATSTKSAALTLTRSLAPSSTRSAAPTVTRSLAPTATRSLAATDTATRTPPATASKSALPTLSAAQTKSKSPASTATDSLQPSATATPAPTATRSAVPTATASRSFSKTKSISLTRLATSTRTVVATPTRSRNTDSQSMSRAVTRSASLLPTHSISRLPTATATETESVTRTISRVPPLRTPTKKLTKSKALTESKTKSMTLTRPPTSTRTALPTRSSSASWSRSATDTDLPTASRTALPTATATATPTVTPTISLMPPPRTPTPLATKSKHLTESRTSSLTATKTATVSPPPTRSPSPTRSRSGSESPTDSGAQPTTTPTISLIPPLRTLTHHATKSKLASESRTKSYTFTVGTLSRAATHSASLQPTASSTSAPTATPTVSLMPLRTPTPLATKSITDSRTRSALTQTASLAGTTSPSSSTSSSMSVNRTASTSKSVSLQQQQQQKTPTKTAQPQQQQQRTKTRSHTSSKMPNTTTTTTSTTTTTTTFPVLATSSTTTTLPATTVPLAVSTFAPIPSDVADLTTQPGPTAGPLKDVPEQQTLQQLSELLVKNSPTTVPGAGGGTGATVVNPDDVTQIKLSVPFAGVGTWVTKQNCGAGATLDVSSNGEDVTITGSATAVKKTIDSCVAFNPSQAAVGRNLTARKILAVSVNLGSESATTAMQLDTVAFNQGPQPLLAHNCTRTVARGSRFSLDLAAFSHSLALPLRTAVGLTNGFVIPQSIRVSGLEDGTINVRGTILDDSPMPLAFEATDGYKTAMAYCTIVPVFVALRGRRSVNPPILTVHAGAAFVFPLSLDLFESSSTFSIVGAAQFNSTVLPLGVSFSSATLIGEMPVVGLFNITVRAKETDFDQYATSYVLINSTNSPPTVSVPHQPAHVLAARINANQPMAVVLDVSSFFADADNDALLFSVDETELAAVGWLRVAFSSSGVRTRAPVELTLSGDVPKSARGTNISLSISCTDGFASATMRGVLEIAMGAAPIQVKELPSFTTEPGAKPISAQLAVSEYFFSPDGSPLSATYALDPPVTWCQVAVEKEGGGGGGGAPVVAFSAERKDIEKAHVDVLVTVSNPLGDNLTAAMRISIVPSTWQEVRAAVTGAAASLAIVSSIISGILWWPHLLNLLWGKRKKIDNPLHWKRSPVYKFPPKTKQFSVMVRVKFMCGGKDLLFVISYLSWYVFNLVTLRPTPHSRPPVWLFTSEKAVKLVVPKPDGAELEHVVCRCFGTKSLLLSEFEATLTDCYSGYDAPPLPDFGGEMDALEQSLREREAAVQGMELEMAAAARRTAAKQAEVQSLKDVVDRLVGRAMHEDVAGMLAAPLHDHQQHHQQHHQQQSAFNNNKNDGNDDDDDDDFDFISSSMARQRAAAAAAASTSTFSPNEVDIPPLAQQHAHGLEYELDDIDLDLIGITPASGAAPAAAAAPHPRYELEDDDDDAGDLVASNPFARAAGGGGGSPSGAFGPSRSRVLSPDLDDHEVL